MKILGSAALIVFLIYLILLLFKKVPSLNKYFTYAALFVLVLGVFLVLSETETYLYYETLKQWPRTEAEIVEVRISGKRALLPEITYHYRVDDSSYQGVSDLGTPPFGARNKRALTAQVVIQEHPVGSKLMIAYDPQHPAHSTTQFHPAWNFYLKTGLGLTFFSIAFLLLLGRLPLNKKEKFFA